MPSPNTDKLQEEIGQLVSAADDYHDEPLGPTTSGEKRSSPDDNGDPDSDHNEEDIGNGPGDESQAELE
jgi:hypothetical protein